MRRGTNLRAMTTASCAALTLAALLCACGGGQQTANEQTPAASPQPTAPAAVAANQESPALVQPGGPQPSATPTPTLVYAPPQASEVRAALERAYKGAVSFDERGQAVVGDFNGDGSEDLLVEVHPAPNRLSELNDELSNWIAADPRQVQPPDPRKFDPHQGVQKLAPAPARPHVESGDALVVVIHGYKESGWRNPEAMQTYLLKNVAGTDLKMEPRAGAQVSVRGRLRLLGDVVREQLGGESGFLYWTGASYGWFH
jgi:ABC-type transport system substrate-binding protein